MKAYLQQNIRILLISIAYCIVIIFLSISTVIAQLDTVNVGTGWNMVGSLYDGPVLDIVRTKPEGIIVSKFYGYNPGGGYEAKDTLKKGVGYWVKVSEDGILIFKSSMWWVCGDALEYSGKIYNTVEIGSQCWMKENLDVGTMILGSDTAKDNSIIEKYCYNNSIENCNIYGGLYTWDEAMQYTTTPGARGICPEGWHIPTSAEFEILITLVGGDGNALKAIGQGVPPDGEGTNTSGFSALLAGGRDIDGRFTGLSRDAVFWSSIEGVESPPHMILYHNNSIVWVFDMWAEKAVGLSVRCLKD